MTRFPCPYLGGHVELSNERERHIAERHPELLPEQRDRIATTLANPDTVRHSSRFADAQLFTRWYDDLRGWQARDRGCRERGGMDRHWIITAYIARRLAAGEAEWAQN